MAGLAQAELPPERVHSIVITLTAIQITLEPLAISPKIRCEIITHRNSQNVVELFKKRTMSRLKRCVLERERTATRRPAICWFVIGPRGPTPKANDTNAAAPAASATNDAKRAGRVRSSPRNQQKELRTRLSPPCEARLCRQCSTPDGTTDHLCLYDPEAGLMLCGDHVLPITLPTFRA